MDTDNPRLIRLTAKLALRAFAEMGDMAVHLNLPPDTDLMSTAARLARNCNEAAAHSLRTVVKARTFAQNDYEKQSGLSDD